MAGELQIKLSERERETISIELARLEAMHGIKVTASQLISILLEQHRLKLRTTVQTDNSPDVLAWLWRRKDGEEL